MTWCSFKKEKSCKNKSRKDIGLSIFFSPFNSVFKKKKIPHETPVWSAAGRVKKVVLWQKKPGCLWLFIWTCRPACKTKLEFLSKFWECFESAFWFDLILMHELVTKFVPISVFSHKILGLLATRLLTLDCEVSHLSIIDSGWVSCCRNAFGPAECPVAGFKTFILRCWAQAKGIYSVFSAQLLLSWVKLWILWPPVMFCCWLQSGWVFSCLIFLCCLNSCSPGKGGGKVSLSCFGFCEFLRRVLSLD